MAFPNDIQLVITQLFKNNTKLLSYMEMFKWYNIFLVNINNRPHNELPKNPSLPDRLLIGQFWLLVKMEAIIEPVKIFSNCRKAYKADILPPERIV
jgi:hypothetical protein